MKRTRSIRIVPVCLMAAALMAVGATTVANAAAPAMQGQVLVRPLTPQETKDYGIPTVQIASGLGTVAIGQPAYLDAQVNYALADSNITSVVWTLTTKPIGSSAVLTN